MVLAIDAGGAGGAGGVGGTGGAGSLVATLAPVLDGHWSDCRFWCTMLF